MSTVRGDTKPGKVIRLSPKLRDFIAKEMLKGETYDATLRRLLSLPAKKSKESFIRSVRYAIESDLFASKAEAKGALIVRSVRSKRKPESETIVKVVCA